MQNSLVKVNKSSKRNQEDAISERVTNKERNTIIYASLWEGLECGGNLLEIPLPQVKHVDTFKYIIIITYACKMISTSRLNLLAKSTGNWPVHGCQSWVRTLLPVCSPRIG